MVVAAPPGQRLDTPQGRAAIQQMIAAGTASQRSLDFHAKDVSTSTNPLAKGAHQLSKDGRIAFFDVQYDKTGFQLPRAGIVDVENKIQAIGQHGGHPRRSSPARPRTRRRPRASPTSSAWSRRSSS